jgi:uncharacterized membrane protein
MTSTVEDEEPDVVADQPAAAERYDVGRLLAFSDGVFAIAITLLVLSIPVPNVPGSGPEQAANLASALLGLRRELFGFGLSFILVGAQWMAHHQILRRLTFTDTRIMWLNLLILLGICLVPFATSLLIRYGDTSTGAIAYATLQLLIGVMFLVMRLYLNSRGAASPTSLLVSAISLSGFAVSIPVALWNPTWTYYLWLAGFASARTLETRIRRTAR